MTSGHNHVKLYSSKAHVFKINPETKNSWLPIGEQAIPITFVASIRNDEESHNTTRRELKLIGIDENGDTPLEAIILSKTVFTKRSQKFGQWTDHTGTVYGLGFNSEAELTEFVDTLQRLQRDILSQPVPQNHNQQQPTASVSKPESVNSLHSQGWSQNERTDLDQDNSQNETHTIDQLRYENERLKKALEESSKNFALWNNELVTLRTNNVKLTQALEESKKNSSDWTTMLSDLEKENQELRQRITVLESNDLDKEQERISESSETSKQLKVYYSKLEKSVKGFVELQTELGQILYKSE